MSYNFTSICAFCGYEADSAAAVNEPNAYPTDGDASLCIKCGKINLFDRHQAGGMRRPSEKEQKDLDASPNVQKVIEAWEATLSPRSKQ